MSQRLGRDIALPVSAFSRFPNATISSLHQALHVPRKNNPLYHPSDWPKRSFKFHFVSHQRSAIVNFKIMVMAEAPKAAAHHAILEILRALISRDAACMCQSDTEVGALPRNLLPRADQPGGQWPARRSSLSRPCANQRCARDRSSARLVTQLM